MFLSSPTTTTKWKSNLFRLIVQLPPNLPQYTLVKYKCCNKHFAVMLGLSERTAGQPRASLRIHSRSAINCLITAIGDYVDEGEGSQIVLILMYITSNSSKTSLSLHLCCREMSVKYLVVIRFPLLSFFFEEIPFFRRKYLWVLTPNAEIYCRRSKAVV